MICLIYLCGPIFYRLGKNTVWLGWAAILSLIVMQITERPYNDSNVLLAFVHFTPLYIMGMYIYARKDDIIGALKPGGAALYLVAAAFAGFFILSAIFGQDFANLQKIALFLLLLKFLAEKEGGDGVWRKAILLAATYSFPIYLIHGYFISAARMISGRFETDNVMIGIAASLALSLIVTAICIAGAWAVHKIFGKKSRYLVGA